MAAAPAAQPPGPGPGGLPVLARRPHRALSGRPSMSLPAPANAGPRRRRLLLLLLVVASTVGAVVVLGTILAADGFSLLRSEEHTSELQSLMRISYAVFCLKKKKSPNNQA